MPAQQEFPFACVVLAAGAGSRFGQPKVHAELRPGTRFIDEVVQLSANAGASPIVAVVPPGVTVPNAATAVINPKAASEQISSLRLGLSRLSNHPAAGTLVWPVDHPYVRLESVLAILDAAQRTGAPIVVPTVNGRRGHPGWFARETWRELLTVEEGGARAVIRAYGSRVVEVEVPDDGVAINVDTPNDLRAAPAS